MPAPDSWSLLVQWDGTTFVEEGGALKAGGEVTVSRGRGSTADDVQSGVLSGSWDNTTGRYTADNALSALYPNLNTREPRTRYAVTIGGVASDRHRGRLTLGTPTWPGSDAAQARVDFESVGMLGQTSRDRLRCDFLERHKFSATGGGVPNDVWPFDEVVTGRTTEELRNHTGSGAGRIIPAVGGVGSAATEAPEGIDLESSIVLTPQNSVGPVLQVTSGLASGTIAGVVIPFRTADRVAAGGLNKYLVQAIDASGSVEWSVRLVDNAGQTDVNLYDTAGVFRATLYFGFSAIGATTGDDQWFSLVLVAAGADTNVFLYRMSDQAQLAGFGIPVAQVDVKLGTTIVLGGSLPGSRVPGKQTLCPAVRYGAVAITSSAGSTHRAYLQLSALSNVQARFTDMSIYSPAWTSTITGTRNIAVRHRQLAGRDRLDVIQELCRTSGAVVVESRTADDVLAFIDSDQQRSDTVALTLDAVLDLDGSGGWPARKGGTPSRVTADWPGGKVTYEDTSREVVEASVQTASATASGAYVVASARANAGRGLRIERLRIDIASSPSSLWATLKDLEIGARIRVTLGAVTGGVVPPFVQQWGRTFVDVYAVGWTEHYGFGVAWWEVDTEPADDPVQGAYGTGRRRKYGAAAGAMTITGGTCVGTTATGTVIVTTASGPTMTTNAAAYPMDLAWNGEDVTVSGPPASAVSPQTLTVSARGVQGTVARVHSAGEAVNVAMPAAYGL